MNRESTGKGAALRVGFRDADQAVADLARLGDAAQPLLALLGRTADPDAALASLVQLAGKVDDPEGMLDELVDDEGTAMRLLTVLGAS